MSRFTTLEMGFGLESPATTAILTPTEQAQHLAPITAPTLAHLAARKTPTHARQNYADTATLTGKAWNNATPLDELVARAEADDAKCHDCEIPARHVTVTPELDIQVADRAIYRSSEPALATLARYAGLPSGTPAAVDALNSPTARERLAEVINIGLEINRTELPKSGFALRLRDNAEGPATVRGIVTGRYTAIDTSFGLKTLARAVPGGRVTHIRDEQEGFSGLCLIPDCVRLEQDSEYLGGIHFRNNEIGRSRFITIPAVFRAVCSNGCIYGQTKGEGIRRRHTGEFSAIQMRREIADNIQRQIPLISRGMAQMLDSKGYGLDHRSAIARIAADAELTDAQKRAWACGWAAEGVEDTAFGLIQGLTRAARDWENPTQAVAMELYAGALTGLDYRRWNADAAHAMDVCPEPETVLGREVVRVIA